MSSIVVYKEGNDDKVHIVDFTKAKVHRCDSEIDVSVYAYAPAEASVQCDQIFEVVDEMNLWTPGVLIWRF